MKFSKSRGKKKQDTRAYYYNMDERQIVNLLIRGSRIYNIIRTSTYYDMTF